MSNEHRAVFMVQGSRVEQYLLQRPAVQDRTDAYAQQGLLYPLSKLEPKANLVQERPVQLLEP